MVEIERQELQAFDPRAAGTPFRTPCHWLLVLIYSLATGAAFWQHGHSALTISVMAAAIILGFAAYVPLRIFDDTFRWFAQFAVVLFAALWAVYRFKDCHAELDVVFTEFLCAAGLSFLLSSDPARYKFLNGISLMLVFYGAVFPRAFYVYAFPLILVLTLMAMYLTRAVAISGSFALASPKRTVRRNWSFMLLHAAIALGCFFAIYQAFPFEGVVGPGLVFVSFKNSQDDYVPEDFRKWMNSNSYKASASASRHLDSGKSPNSASQKAKTVSENIPMLSDKFAPGNGAGPAGDRLVFRVFSPVKLYWACRMYDLYDGENWYSSRALDRGVNRYDDAIWKTTESVEQKFRLESVFSKSLPCAYMPVSLATDNSGKVSTVASSYGYRLASDEAEVATPFAYSVISRLPLQGASASSSPYSSGDLALPSVPVWSDNVPRRVYLSLPTGRISQRLQSLAAELCARAQSPFAKAVAIRDWLRRSFAYEQFTQPIPKGVEPVDRFVFELKRGHCEYFAAAMTTLARLSGLPARLVTGFSPGNFDAVNKCFNVYEYHAHAWCQVYIDGVGWLTFDPTPPGQLVSRTTPYGLGSLQDPFGDEWKILPPELAKETQRHLSLRRAENSLQAGVEKAVSAPAAQALIDTLMRIPFSREEISQTLREFKTKKSLKDVAAKKGSVSLVDTLRLNFLIALDGAKRAINRAANWIFGFNGLVISIIALVVMLAKLSLSSLREKSLMTRRLSSALARFDEATAKAPKHPEASVAACYWMTRELLDLAGCPRVDNMDLFDYGKSLELPLGPALSTEILVVFFLYSRSIYSPQACSREDSSEALQRAISIRQMMIPLIRR